MPLSFKGPCRAAAAAGLMALALCGVPAPAHAATYTVAPDGRDSNDGQSAPFQTLQRGVRALRDGDVLTVRSGVYTAGVALEGRNLTIRGEGEVVLDGTNAPLDNGLFLDEVTGVTVENLKVRNCRRAGILVTLSQKVTLRGCEASFNGASGILTGNSFDVRVERCTAVSNAGHGVYLSQSGDRLQVLHCELTGNQRAGLQINGTEEAPNPADPAFDGISEECHVEGNGVLRNGAAGGAAIDLMGVTRSLIANNLVAENLSGGIALWDDDAGPEYASRDNRLWHNTVAFPPGRGWFGIQARTGSTGNSLLNNILVCGAGSAIEAWEPIDSDYNLLSGPTIVNEDTLTAWRRASGNDVHSFEAEPRFTPDYHLAEDSPARDAGKPARDHDREGNPRPQGGAPDLGCYEEAPSNSPPVQEALVLYGDSLISGWRAARNRASHSLAAKTPVAQGSRSIALTLQRNGWLRLAGAELPVGPRRVLKLMVNGGATGGQQLQVRLITPAGLQTPVDLSAYGSSPAAGQWTEYVIPLADLGVAPAVGITGLRIGAASAQKKLFLDHIRVE